MNAKEGSARPAALGRGLDTLMGNEEERDAPSAAETPDGPEGPHRPATPDARRCQDPEHAHGKSAGLVGGLIAGGAAACFWSEDTPDFARCFADCGRFRRETPRTCVIMERTRFEEHGEPMPDNPADRQHPNDPLHGITLETMLKQLVNKYGWDGLAKRIRINCFKKNPNFKSSLTFLRKTPWARSKVEELYKNSRFWVDL